MKERIKETWAMMKRMVKDDPAVAGYNVWMGLCVTAALFLVQAVGYCQGGADTATDIRDAVQKWADEQGIEVNSDEA